MPEIINCVHILTCKNNRHSCQLVFFKKKWSIPGLFFFIFVSSNQLTENKCSINFADDWIRTTDLWYHERLLYQLSHNL